MAYVTHATQLCYILDPDQHDNFLEELKKAVARAHQEVHDDAAAGGVRGMATTLTLVAFIWPMAYLVHVGDSRCYRLRDGQLQRMTHDQTMAQALVDAGALTNSKAEQSPLKHILTSAVGSDELAPRGRERHLPVGRRADALHRRAHQARERSGNRRRCSRAARARRR